jgi:hypothetical protein
MKILSIRKGFQADHSSTSYEFFAVDRPLTASERKNVSSLSSRAMPTKHRVSFIYHGDWSDLPGGWEPLVEQYYDVMYSESYDWWTLAMAFDTDQKTINQISVSQYSGINDMGVQVYVKGNRVVVWIHCRMDPGIFMDENGYGYYGHNDDWDDEDDLEEEDEVDVKSDDSLLDLLAENREYLKKVDYRLLYGIMELWKNAVMNRKMMRNLFIVRRKWKVCPIRLMSCLLLSK